MSERTSEVANAYREGELAALDEFSKRFGKELERIQSKKGGFLGRSIMELPSEITKAAGNIIREMRKERE
jgi:hypothetical protein